MRHYSFLLHCMCVLVLPLAILSKSSAASTDVFYLASGSTITTYNVNPTTGAVTQVGTPLTIAGAPFIGNIIPAPNDHFLNVFWPNASYKYSLSVYATDASGVPQSKPVQTLSAPDWQMMIDPNGKYAYVLQTTSSQGQYSSTLYLYNVNQTTGVLTKNPTVQATYGPNYYYLESLVSFNKARSRLYDLWSVNFDGENNYYYSYHTINAATGQLGPDAGTYYAVSNYAGLDEQYFTTNYILNLSNNNTGPSVLNVYQNVSNPKQPLFVCTQSMLSACGDAYNFFVSVDEQYVFLPDPNTGETVIARIEGSSKEIVQTGSIAGTSPIYLSPDNRLLYTVDESNGVVQAYTFNSTDGTVIPGGTAAFNVANGYELSPAVR